MLTFLTSFLQFSYCYGTSGIAGNWVFQCLRRGISHFFLYNKTLKKLYRPSKYLEKSWNFALAKMEETCLSCVLDTKLCAEWKINPLPYVLSAFRTIREVMRGRGGVVACTISHYIWFAGIGNFFSTFTLARIFQSLLA